MKTWHTVTLWHSEEWAQVLRRDPCVYCGGPSGTVEHVDPRGSRGTVLNGVGACRSCNNERGSAPMLTYLMWRVTDRAESFSRWNWRLHPQAIQKNQLKAKEARRLAKATPEERAPTLTAPLAEFQRVDSRLVAESAKILSAE